MTTQERTFDGEPVSPSVGLFGKLAHSSPIKSRTDGRDSLLPLEVEVAPADKPARLKTVWTMAAIGVVAMIGAVAAHARTAPHAVEAAEVTIPAPGPSPE